MITPLPGEDNPPTLTRTDAACVDCHDDIWPGEPSYPTPGGPRCLICQAQIVPWVADDAEVQA